jgi:hypothetical protein
LSGKFVRIPIAVPPRADFSHDIGALIGLLFQVGGVLSCMDGRMLT